MKQIIPAVVLLFFLTACCEPVEPDLPACASAPAEVPEGEDGGGNAVVTTMRRRQRQSEAAGSEGRKKMVGRRGGIWG